MALRKLLSKSERMNLNQRCRYQCIDPDAKDKLFNTDRKMMRLFTSAITVDKKDQLQHLQDPGAVVHLTDGFYSSSDDSIDSNSEFEESSQGIVA